MHTHMPELDDHDEYALDAGGMGGMYGGGLDDGELAGRAVYRYDYIPYRSWYIAGMVILGIVVVLLLIAVCVLAARCKKPSVFVENKDLNKEFLRDTNDLTRGD